MQQRFSKVARWGGESGKAGLGSLIGIVVLVVAVYLGMKIIPVRASAYQLDDAVREQVVYAGARRRRVGDDEVNRNLLETAEELGLPVTKRNIRITRRSKSVQIVVAYKVPIDFGFGFTYEWTFVSDHDGPSL